MSEFVPRSNGSRRREAGVENKETLTISDQSLDEYADLLESAVTSGLIKETDSDLVLVRRLRKIRDEVESKKGESRDYLAPFYDGVIGQLDRILEEDNEAALSDERSTLGQARNYLEAMHQKLVDLRKALDE